MSGYCPEQNPLLASSPLTSLYSQSLDLVQSMYPPFCGQIDYGSSPSSGYGSSVGSGYEGSAGGMPLGSVQPLGSSSSLSSYDARDQLADEDFSNQLEQVQSVLVELLQK